MSKIKPLFYITNLFFVVSATQVHAQYELPFLEEFFFSRNSSVRVESMGKAYAPTESEVSCVSKNPAGISNIKGIETEFSYSSPFYAIKDGKYLFAGAGFTVNKYISIAAAVNRFSFGSTFFTDNMGNPVSGPIPSETNYSFSLASQPVKNLNIGVTVNYFNIDFPMINSTGAFYPDIGAIKYFDIGKKKTVKQKFFLGQSFSDFIKAKVTFQAGGEQSKGELPSISRTQIGYNIFTADSNSEKNLQSNEATFVFEYEEVLNSKDATSYRFGIEYKLFNILALRTGYYRQKVNDYDNPVYNKSEISDFTYGFGISVPFELLSKNKTPLTIKIDFATMRQTPYTQTGSYGRFTSLNLSLNYIFRKK